MTTAGSSEANTSLAALLDEAGWSPRSLAREINSEFGAGRVSGTAPYHWRDGGSVPRWPLPAMVCAVLARQLGRPVAVTEIWPKCADGRAAGIELASFRMDGPWDRSSAVKAIADWLAGGETSRRAFLAVSGTDLLQAVRAWLGHQMVPLPSPLAPYIGNGEPLLDHIEASIPLLQRLDDARGGGAHLAYVEAQLRAVGLVLCKRRHTEQASRRLLAACATLGQLTGWMAFDASRHGVAQRYWFTALRAAREVGDRPLASHILADLAFQAASRGRPGDAVTLAEAAARAAERSPATVRASVASRLGYSYAAAGRRRDFEKQRTEASRLLESRHDASEPPWMYFLTQGHLDCQAGYTLVALGRHLISLGDHDGYRDLAEAHALLRTGAYRVPADDPSQRRALFEGAWLALGHAAQGDYREAGDLAVAAAARLDQVHSPRSNQVLGQVAADLRTHARNPDVREFLPGFEQTLATMSL